MRDKMNRMRLRRLRSWRAPSSGKFVFGRKWLSQRLRDWFFHTRSCRIYMILLKKMNYQRLYGILQKVRDVHITCRRSGRSGSPWRHREHFVSQGDKPVLSEAWPFWLMGRIRCTHTSTASGNALMTSRILAPVAWCCLTSHSPWWNFIFFFERFFDADGPLFVMFSNIVWASRDDADVRDTHVHNLVNATFIMVACRIFITKVCEIMDTRFQLC